MSYQQILCSLAILRISAKVTQSSSRYRLQVNSPDWETNGHKIQKTMSREFALLGQATENLVFWQWQHQFSAQKKDPNMRPIS